jgi:hypothetical protein
MGWKVVVATGSVLLAAVGGAGWAVAASATGPSPVIGPPVVVSPAARHLPSPFPSTGEPSLAPRGSGSPHSTPGSAVPSGSESAVVVHSPSRSPDAAAPETVDPEYVQPVEDDGGGTQVGDD